MKKRVQGFKKVAPDLIRANPGLPAEEYAKMALDLGLCGSAAKDPIFSLASTLRKEVREGRMPGIRAEKVDTKLCFFPDNHAPNSRDAQPRVNMSITIIVPPHVAETIDMLVELDKFKNRTEALVWLVGEGIKAKSHELDQVNKTIQQIRHLKQSVTV